MIKPNFKPTIQRWLRALVALNGKCIQSQHPYGQLTTIHSSSSRRFSAYTHTHTDTHTYKIKYIFYKTPSSVYVYLCQPLHSLSLFPYNRQGPRVRTCGRSDWAPGHKSWSRCLHLSSVRIKNLEHSICFVLNHGSQSSLAYSRTFHLPASVSQILQQQVCTTIDTTSLSLSLTWHWAQYLGNKHEYLLNKGKVVIFNKLLKILMQLKTCILSEDSFVKRYIYLFYISTM